MRILMLSWEYPPHVVGGLGQHVADLVPALAGLGVEVHLVTPEWGPGAAVADHPGVTVHRVVMPVANGDIMAQALATNRALEAAAAGVISEAGPIDIIHAHDWLVAFAASSLKQQYKTPLIATIHATEYGRHRGHIVSDMSRAIHDTEWRLSYEAWRIICCSEFMAAEIASLPVVGSNHSDGVALNGLFVWMNSDARNRICTTLVTASAMLLSRSVMVSRLYATKAAKHASSHSQNRSEPSRPAHTPEMR